MDRYAPLGVYDSGVGGLTVVRELRRQLPTEQIIYLADSARLPYGDRPPQEIQLFARQIITFLLSQGVKMVVIACNTSSALALPIIREEFSLPLIGMIEPGVNAALRVSGKGKVGVIATQGTVDSDAYGRMLRQHGVKVYSQACPRFVPLIESGHINSPQMAQAIDEYLGPLRAAGVDALIYGCTHYPFLDSQIQAYMGQIKTVDPAVEAVWQAGLCLGDMGLVSPGKKNRDLFFTTGDPKEFAEGGARLLGQELDRVEQIDLSAEG